MRLFIGARELGAGLTATNYVGAKQLMREYPVSVLQIICPATSRESLLGFLAWCSGKQILPTQVVLNQVSPADREAAKEFLIARGYRTSDRVTFIKIQSAGRSRSGRDRFTPKENRFIKEFS
ncbi:hypothetical protein PVT68_00800 [Microbulbifer bruguierae]|uniref:Uncharacterized protein n=1 Tax=Microbulbifer bruguierae TaxID=3029061 RepID=A0ABY8ND56_9GAMM|nr:hypothetical protein [Microbulbifer bruguierae]WGL16851.1 hypothetical protein PVT68_00800 [Microbulbifer bruguierae]